MCFDWLKIVEKIVSFWICFDEISFLALIDGGESAAAAHTHFYILLVRDCLCMFLIECVLLLLVVVYL